MATDATLCVLISNERFSRSRMALLTAIHYVQPKYVIIGLSEERQAADWESKILKTLNENGFGTIPIRFTAGANSRAEVAATRARIFDQVETDWIVSIDDDDGVLGSMMLPSIDHGTTIEDWPDVGFVHSDVLGVCRQVTGPWQPGDCWIRRGKLIEDAKDANMFRGSYYAYRTRAWKEIRELVGEETAYEEWRVVWHMIQAGWKDHYIPRVLQWQGLRDYVGEATRTQAGGLNWEVVQSELALQCGHDPDTKGRWWQNWDRPESRHQIQNYWSRASEQPERRQHFYDVLERSVRRFKRGVKLLDFGCGTGEDYIPFQSMGATYTGSDVTPGMLGMFRKRHRDADIYEDDLIAGSRWKDREWPIVVNNAVLPHLPEEQIEKAVAELWRITGKLLVVRLFGVDKDPGKSRAFTHEGFLYQWWPRDKWLKLFTDLPDRACLEYSQGKTARTKDCLVVLVERAGP
jgi:ubiquinone/menaquinone biosynthesis C-methylase UbiE